jgi:photosystem II stability/assembly factor-like uncharacterized protein
MRDDRPQRRQPGRATFFATVGLCAAAIAVASLWVTRARAGQPLTAESSGVGQTPGRWVNIGPAPMVRGNTLDGHSGRVASIAVDPSNPERWLLGVGNGGVWETRDSGRTWQAIADDAPTLASGDIAFAPSDANVIYAATGEPVYGMGHGGLGILRSTDSGRSWLLLGASTFSRVGVKRVRVHPSNPGVVMAASLRSGAGRSSSADVRQRSPSGIWKSTDGGATWSRKLGGEATALEIDPSNFNNQYAAIGEQSPGFLALDPPGSAANGIYRSSDGGETWSLIDGPWGTGYAVGRIEIAIAPSNPKIVYASIQRGGSTDAGLLGLYRTDDAFAAAPAWTKIPTDQTNNDYCGSGETKCGYVHFLSVDPGDANRLFAGGRLIWRCTNCAGSPTWNNVNFGTADFHATTWVGNRIVVGNDYGVFSTTDFGRTWQNHNGELPTGMLYSGALHPSDPGFILGGFRDFGSVVQQGGNHTWRALGPSVAAEGEVAMSASRPATDWMTSRNTILRTTDGGQSAIKADHGIDWSGSQAFVQPVRKCPGNDNVFLAATNRIWRTNDFFNSNAPSWAANSPGGDVREGFGAIHSIAYVASDTACNSYAYGTQGGRVRMTQNGGTTWVDLDPRRMLPLRPITWLAFDPTNPNVLYATLSLFDDFPPGRPTGHVFKTTNVGADTTWRDISPPSDTPFNVVAIDPRNPQRVYAGSDLGLWHSNDGGESWIKDGLDVGLPNVSVYDIQINPTTNRTVIFTYGRSAYALSSQ